jgi:hypothetical protein
MAAAAAATGRLRWAEEGQTIKELLSSSDEDEEE